MSGVALTRLHQRRLREIHRSAGWPCHDNIELDLLSGGWIARQADPLGRETLRLTDTGITALAQARARNRQAYDAHEALVERRIHQAIAAGCDGVIASPHEAALARALGGRDFLVVTPGVRPDWSAKNDQARAATPLEALEAGASHIVCGRPITAANDPEAAARRVAGEMIGA